jgi:hypothetical protein
MLTPYETPEMRSLFSHFTNLAGKLRIRNPWPPLAVPEGIKQVCTATLHRKLDAKRLVRLLLNLNQQIPTTNLISDLNTSLHR